MPERTKKLLKKPLNASFIFTFFIMLGIWILLSGRYDFFHLALGVISCLIVAALSDDFLLSPENVKRFPIVWYKFIRYIPWLLGQVLLANMHVLYLSFHPRMMDMIDPQLKEFKSILQSDIARVTLANSITLTPGTITVYVSILGDYTVHMIDEPSGENLPGEMETRVAAIFGE